MAKTKPKARPEYVAIGRVVRAITYPVISSELDLTLRDLNALATLAHVNDETGAGQPSTADNFIPCDSFDALTFMPGTGQAFWAEEQFTVAAQRLAQFGLVTITPTTGTRVTRLHETDNTGPGMLVKLTKAGESLLDGMCGNLKKALGLLDDKAVRKELALYS